MAPQPSRARSLSPRAFSPPSPGPSAPESTALPAPAPQPRAFSPQLSRARTLSSRVLSLPRAGPSASSLQFSTLPRPAPQPSAARLLIPATPQTSARPGAWAPPPRPLSPSGPGHPAISPGSPAAPTEGAALLEGLLRRHGVKDWEGRQGRGSRLLQAAAAIEGPTVATATSLVSLQPTAPSSDQRTAPGGGAKDEPTPPPWRAWRKRGYTQRRRRGLAGDACAVGRAPCACARTGLYARVRTPGSLVRGAVPCSQLLLCFQYSVLVACNFFI